MKWTLRRFRLRITNCGSHKVFVFVLDVGLESTAISKGLPILKQSSRLVLSVTTPLPYYTTPKSMEEGEISYPVLVTNKNAHL